MTDRRNYIQIYIQFYYIQIYIQFYYVLIYIVKPALDFDSSSDDSSSEDEA